MSDQRDAAYQAWLKASAASARALAAYEAACRALYWANRHGETS